MADQRGLVISNPIEFFGRAIRTKQTNLDPQELRFSLLFWDKLDCPEIIGGIMQAPLDSDGQYLAASGILQRTR